MDSYPRILIELAAARMPANQGIKWLHTFITYAQRWTETWKHFLVPEPIGLHAPWLSTAKKQTSISSPLCCLLDSRQHQRQKSI